MSFIDLATLALHRRNEMEARINVFLSKCDHAINDILKMKMLAQSFVEHLNCDPRELKERFLNCMKQLDEYTYLITDFNLAVNKLDANSNIELAPVHDITNITIPSIILVPPFNLMDALTEPMPSTSNTCPNQCPSEKPECDKVPKSDQPLIAFSSCSDTSESVQQTKNIQTAEKEVQCDIDDDDSNEISNTDIERPKLFEHCNLPAQAMLQTDHEYPATILNVDGMSFWITTENPVEVHGLIVTMTKYYRNNYIELTLEEVTSLTYCACYDDDGNCYYRCLFIRLIEEDMNVAEVFLVDTGEVQTSPIVNLQPLAPQFYETAPYARCCHLAGVDILNNNTEIPEKLEEFLKEYVGVQCTIVVDDNTSESLGVYVKLSSNTTLNNLLIEQGLVHAIEKVTVKEENTVKGPAEMLDTNINDCPEYEDPVVAVTGYHNRDEADICKHYKGGPLKTCFKGPGCTKKHVIKHPDGWTLDRVPVAGKCRPLPLPAPGSCLQVQVTHVAHYDRIYVQLVQPKQEEQVPPFGSVYPAKTLTCLVRDMNSPAARMAYKPLKMTPAPGELVAALYPPDDMWYRARVLSTTRVDQNVEVMYIDYGNVAWVREDRVRELEPRHWALEAQALRCSLAGVVQKSHDSRQWAEAKELLRRLAVGPVLKARVVARDYDEISVELYDEKGGNIAEQLAASKLVELTTYVIVDDSKVKQKIVVP